MELTNKYGNTVPFFVWDFTYEDIRTAAFDPITTSRDGKNVSADMTAARRSSYVDGGFFVRPDTDGALYGITWEAYQRNGKSLTGLTPQKFLGAANSWIECPFVFIYNKNHGTYPSTSDYINAALIQY